MCKVYLVLCVILFSAVLSFPEETPENVVKTFISAITSGNLDEALKVCALDDYAAGFDFEAAVGYYNAFIDTKSVPGTSDFNRRIIFYERLGEMVKQIKYFCFGFYDNPDIRELCKSNAVSVKDAASISQSAKDVDQAKLKNLKMIKIKLLKAASGTRLRRFWDKEAKIYGALERMDGIALLALNGKTYGIGLELTRYKPGWKIYSLHSHILNTDINGCAFPFTEDQFNKIDADLKSMLVAPDSK